MQRLLAVTNLVPLLHSFRFPVTISDWEGKFIYVNRAFTDVYGWKLSEILGLKSKIILPRDADQNSLQSLKSNTKKDGFSQVLRLHVLTKSGLKLDANLLFLRVELSPTLPELFFGISSPSCVEMPGYAFLGYLLGRLLASKSPEPANALLPSPAPCSARQVLHLRRLGYSSKEIAAFLGVAENTPNVLIHRFRKKRSSAMLPAS
jgi:PAS domain S-box-containing protein